jgi:hypothetical protein
LSCSTAGLGRATAGRENRWLDAKLLENVKDRARELALSDNELNAAAYSSWLDANTETSQP